ncbi:MAG TPA: hypothetical protein VKF35_08030 [Hyphomicrobiaceae bacterium]|jgi:hypothetical protein|nr:hypothetical protein [Hyphomicrobiaceae bacterium]
MRSMIVVLSLAGFAACGLALPASAAKTKMGCQVGKEVWNAADGKCVPGKSKHAGKTASKAKKKQ